MELRPCYKSGESRYWKEDCKQVVLRQECAIVTKLISEVIMIEFSN
jgi:hypothetical protein